MSWVRPWVGLFVSRDDLTTFLAGETLVMAIVNAILTVFVCWLVFGGVDPVPVWGDAGLAKDLIPSTVIPVALMCLTATPPIRMRARKGKTPAFDWYDTGRVVQRLPCNLLLRTVILCAVWLVLFVPVTVGALWLTGLDTLPFATLMLFKAVYGFVVGASICPFVALPAAARA